MLVLVEKTTPGILLCPLSSVGSFTFITGTSWAAVALLCVLSIVLTNNFPFRICGAVPRADCCSGGFFFLTWVVVVSKSYFIFITFTALAFQVINPRLYYFGRSSARTMATGGLLNSEH